MKTDDIALGVRGEVLSVLHLQQSRFTMKRNMLMLGPVLLGFMLTAEGSAQQPTYTNVFDQIQNSKDIEAVRMVVMREIEGCLKGNAEQIFSCYDIDSFVGYDMKGSQDAKTWTVDTVGREELQKYVDYNKGFPAKLSKNPGITMTAEIQHVHVKGNNALAVAKQHWLTPDKEKGKTTTEDWESVFLLKKNAKGEWKITGWLGGTTWKREVTDLVSE